MKKIILIVSLCLGFLCINAQNSNTQFSNNGFEQWSSSSNPQSWNSLGYMGYSLCEVSKSTQHVGGSYSLQLKSKKLSSIVAALFNIPQINVPGFITNGTIDVMTLMTSATPLMDYQNMDLSDYMPLLQSLKNVLTDGLRISDLPETIEGYYDFSPISNNDVFVIFAYTTGTVADSLAVTGGGVFYANSATDGFESFSIPINYLANNAEELYLVGLVLNINDEATEFGSVRLDDINITYIPESSCSDIVNEENDVAAFPNPTKNGFSINTKAQEKVEIFDLMGRKVKEITDYSPNTPIYVENKGTYIVKIAEKNLKVIVE